MVHGVGEFLEGAFERQRLPTFAAVERQAIGTRAERSQSKTGIGAVFVGTTNDEMTAARNHVKAARRLTRVEQRL